MAIIDIVILVLVAVGAFIGYRCGLLAGIGSICGLLAGIVACHLFGDIAYDVLCRHTDLEYYLAAPYTGTILAYIIVFLPVYGVFWLAGRSLRAFAASLKLGGIDHVGGAFFGVLEYLFATSIVLNLVYVIAPYSAIFKSSHLAGGLLFEFVMDIAPFVWGANVFPNLA